MSKSVTLAPLPCDKILLGQYLDSKLPAQAQAALEEHLNSCQGCRVWLESVAADVEFWRTATEALDASNAPQISRPLAELSLEALAAVQPEFNGLDTRIQFGEVDTESTLSQSEMLKRWLDPSPREDGLGRIAKYEVLGIVGQGGMGLVLKAFDTELTRFVAIKTLAHHVTARPDARLRLAREARAAAGLRHPNIVSIFAFETWRDMPFIVMPLVEGGTLQQYATRQKLSTEQVVTTGLQIASALAALHAVGIVHRDLKPSNILLQDGLEHVLLSDFGLARFDGDLAITQSDALAGTPFFMSPEQALGKPLDVRSDLFSFGSVLYWLCTGRYPFRGDSNYETMAKLVHSEVDLGELARSETPAYLQRLILRLLAKDPAERWESANEVSHLLRSVLAHYRSPEERLPVALCEPTPNRTTAKRWGWPLAASLVGLVAIAVGIQQNFGLPKDQPSQQVEANGEAVVQSGQNSQRSYLEPPRYGVLDELDHRAMLSDFRKGEKLHYWLRRLAYLSVDEIPADAIPSVQKLADHDDQTTRELSRVILNKNPFQEVIILENVPVSSSNSESPFEEVLPNE